MEELFSMLAIPVATMAVLRADEMLKMKPPGLIASILRRRASSLPPDEARAKTFANCLMYTKSVITWRFFFEANEVRISYGKYFDQMTINAGTHYIKNVHNGSPKSASEHLQNARTFWK
jgi:hypothetical protein